MPVHLSNELPIVSDPVNLPFILNVSVLRLDPTRTPKLPAGAFISPGGVATIVVPATVCLSYERLSVILESVSSNRLKVDVVVDTPVPTPVYLSNELLRVNESLRAPPAS